MKENCGIGVAYIFGGDVWVGAYRLNKCFDFENEDSINLNLDALEVGFALAGGGVSRRQMQKEEGVHMI